MLNSQSKMPGSETIFHDYGEGKMQKNLAEWVSDSQETVPGIPSMSTRGADVEWPVLDTQWANDIPSAQGRPSTPTHEEPDTDDENWGPDAKELLQYAWASDTVASQPRPQDDGDSPRPPCSQGPPLPDDWSPVSSTEDDVKNNVPKEPITPRHAAAEATLRLLTDQTPQQEPVLPQSHSGVTLCAFDLSQNKFWVLPCKLCCAQQCADPAVHFPNLDVEWGPSPEYAQAQTEQLMHPKPVPSITDSSLSGAPAGEPPGPARQASSAKIDMTDPLGIAGNSEIVNKGKLRRKLPTSSTGDRLQRNDILAYAAQYPKGEDAALYKGVREQIQPLKDQNGNHIGVGIRPLEMRGMVCFWFREQKVTASNCQNKMELIELVQQWTSSWVDGPSASKGGRGKGKTGWNGWSGKKRGLPEDDTVPDLAVLQARKL